MGDEAALYETSAPPCTDEGGDGGGAGAYDPAATQTSAGGIRPLNLPGTSHASHPGIGWIATKREEGGVTADDCLRAGWSPGRTNAIARQRITLNAYEFVMWFRDNNPFRTGT